MFFRKNAGLTAKLTHTKENPLYVVFPPAITRYAFEAAETISEYIRFMTGIAPVRTCEAKIPEGADAIVLGDTALPENRAELEGLNYGECRITFGKNRLICASYTDETLKQAAETVIDNMTYENGTLTVTAPEHALFITLPGYISYIPVCDAGTQVAYRESSKQCTQIVVTGMTAETYEAYLGKCQNEGFEILSRNEITGNLFCRMRKYAVSLYVYFTPYNGTVRILCEPIYNMHKEEDVDAHPAVCNPLMTVLGGRWSTTSRYLNLDSGSGGMGYIFRLDDGRFLLVDGCMELGNYADNIMAALREQAPDPNHIVIACWFFSHTHIDHTGGFLKVVSAFAKEVEIEEICYNFPSIGDAEAYREAWNTRRMSEGAYQTFPKAAVSKLHTGEILHYGSATVEVLCTQEDLIRQYFSVLNEGITWNTTSMVIRLTVGGSTVFLPGDSDNWENDIMTAMYGSYLKSDILQICHHGGWGGTTELYANVDPELAIFSTSDELFPKYLQIQYNHDVVYDMHVTEVHNNADRSRVFELPYHPTERRIPDDPKEEILYTKAKQLEALASIENLRKEQLGK